ncbi:hypothetical protein [Pseudomonas xantholysinigenes]|uniref:Uncharacterized protein n=1 Tax=Pseudomonas xantholysinigenes TaxID=2745490 RepID=A0A9E6TXE7_9PSED|nr:hypothetical protein [Pseudomonas xantholysinigenes]QXI37885.1 hypothetical protein HU772_021560 [Pseudomonas xantholysinigenes]
MNLHVVASLLARGRQLERLSDGITLLALACSLAPLLGLPLHPLAHLLCAALLLIGLAHKYWAIRVALDAELFARLGASSDLPADTQALDHALVELRLKPSASDARDWPTRSQGALALLRRQALCLTVQVVLALILPFTG